MDKVEFLKLFTECIENGDIKMEFIPEVIGNSYPDMYSPYVKEEAKIDIIIKKEML